MQGCPLISSGLNNHLIKIFICLVLFFPLINEAQEIPSEVAKTNSDLSLFLKLNYGV